MTDPRVQSNPAAAEAYARMLASGQALREQLADLTERRATFVYEATRLAAIAAQAPLVPAPWAEREEPFRAQFREVIERQCSRSRSASPEELHDSWWDAYIRGPVPGMGWRFRPPNALFVALCEIARQWVKGS